MFERRLDVMCLFFFCTTENLPFFLKLTKKNLAQKSHLSSFFFTHSCDGKKNSSSAREFSACLGFFSCWSWIIFSATDTQDRVVIVADDVTWSRLNECEHKTQKVKHSETQLFSCVFHLTKLGWAEGEVEQKKDWNRVKIWKWFIDASCAPISLDACVNEANYGPVRWFGLLYKC